MSYALSVVVTSDRLRFPMHSQQMLLAHTATLGDVAVLANWSTIALIQLSTGTVSELHLEPSSYLPQELRQPLITESRLIYVTNKCAVCLICLHVCFLCPSLCPSDLLRPHTFTPIPYSEVRVCALDKLQTTLYTYATALPGAVSYVGRLHDGGISVLSADGGSIRLLTLNELGERTAEHCVPSSRRPSPLQPAWTRRNGRLILSAQSGSVEWLDMATGKLWLSQQPDDRKVRPHSITDRQTQTNIVA